MRVRDSLLKFGLVVSLLILNDSLPNFKFAVGSLPIPDYSNLNFAFAVLSLPILDNSLPNFEFAEIGRAHV